MTDLNVPTLDESVHTTNVWLQEIQSELGAKDRTGAYAAMRGALTALRDRLPVEEAAHLGAQLPLLVRGVFYEQYKPAGQPHAVRDRDAFLGLVGKGFGDADDLGFGPEEAARAVFTVLSRHIDNGEADKVRTMLNDELKPLWPKAA